MQGVRRGFLKYYVLKILRNSTETGYGIRKKIKEETGFWEPSEGSIYPLLESLEKRGLIKCVDQTNGKRWSITESGKQTLDKGESVKNEMFDSMIKSILVFSELFEEEDMSQFAKEMAKWRERSPKDDMLKASFLELHNLICELPRVEEEKQKEVAEILRRATEEVKEEIYEARKDVDQSEG